MLFLYSLVVDLDGVISKFDAAFPTEEAANDFAEIMAEFLVEFAFIEETFAPPF